MSTAMAAVQSLASLFSSVFRTKTTPPPPQLKLCKTTAFTPLVASATSYDDSAVLAVVYPSMALANTLYFKSGFNTQIKVDENEPEDRIVIRFKRAVLKARVLQECRRRRFFENTQEKTKRKTREAARRYRKRRPQPRIQVKQEAPKKKEDDDEDDNWELPEGDLPYCQ